MNTPLTLRKLRQARVAGAVAAGLLVAAPSAPTFAGGDPVTPAARASKPEATGVASGFAVGAAAGGPIGALLGAAAGGWLGDRMHRDRQSLERTREQLAEASQRGAGLTMHVMFRTDESSVPAGDEPLVAQFATLAAGTPGAVVYVTGFADPRGTPRYNAALAAERAATVAARLVASGLPAERLVVSSETAIPIAADTALDAAPPDLDGYAFQRRATLRIALPAQGRTLKASRR